MDLLPPTDSHFHTIDPLPSFAIDSPVNPLPSNFSPNGHGLDSEHSLPDPSKSTPFSEMPKCLTPTKQRLAMTGKLNNEIFLYLAVPKQNSSALQSSCCKHLFSDCVVLSIFVIH